MYQTYAAVGSVLLILGVVYTYLFVRLLLGDKKCSQKILSLSEAIVTVFIGVFYLYSAIILNENSEKVGETTNSMDDIMVVRNNTPDKIYQTVNINDILVTQTEVMGNTEVTTENNNNELSGNVTKRMDINDNLAIQTEIVNGDADVTTADNVIESPANENETTSRQPAKEILAESDKADQFLQKYQSFIREMMKDKLKNGSSSVYNQTNLAKLRGKREIKLEAEKKPNCFREFFIHNALLIYSFVHCLITVLNNTLQCKNCIKNEGGSRDKKEMTSRQEDWKNDGSIDNNSERNEVSAPVGPLFEIENAETNNTPNLKLFEARVKETKSTSETIIQVEKEHNVIKADMAPPHVKLALQVILTYLLPVMGIVILYCITNEETLETVDLNLNLFKDHTFITTQASSDMLNRIQAPGNITNSESLEVDRVIKNVYNIVNQIRENVTNKTTHFSPLMVETLYYLKPNQRNPKVKMEKCPTINQPIKTYYFFIFIAAYFAAILYAKIIHIDAKSKRIPRAKEQNVSLLTFSALWLPSVLDIFFRMFVTQESTTIFSDLFLALGNTNRIYTMASDHIQCKKSISKPNFIKPETL